MEPRYQLYYTDDLLIMHISYATISYSYVCPFFSYVIFCDIMQLYAFLYTSILLYILMQPGSFCQIRLAYSTIFHGHLATGILMHIIQYMHIG